MIKQYSRKELQAAGLKFGKAKITAKEYIKDKMYTFIVDAGPCASISIISRASMDRIMELLGVSDINEIKDLTVRDAYDLSKTKAFNYKRYGVWAGVGDLYGIEEGF